MDVRSVEKQRIRTAGAEGLESFRVGNHYFLAVANAADSDTWNVDSIVYQYDATNPTAPFQEIQKIPTHGAYDFESFVIENQTYLVVANSNDGSSTSINSIIYQYDETNSAEPFQERQQISTHDGCDWEAFEIEGSYFLVVSNHKKGESYDTNSVIYIYDSSLTTDLFRPMQSILTHGAYGMEYFHVDGVHYLFSSGQLSKWIRLQSRFDYL